MRRPVRIRNKELLKEKCENNLSTEKNNLDPVGSTDVVLPENSITCNERIVLKDQTNVLQSGQELVSNTPSSSTSIKYSLRRTNSVDYKKLSNGIHTKVVFKEKFKDDSNSVKHVTPKSTNKILKSVLIDKISADYKSNAESEVKSAFKNSKPIYNIHTNTPRARQSMPVEKKLAIYEFEVDENEPKVKQKKKRIRKVKDKNLKKDQNKITTKNFASCLKKLRREDQKRVLSTKNKSILGSRTPVPAQELNTDVQGSLTGQKDNFNSMTFEVPVLFHNHQDASPAKTNNSAPKPVFSAMSDDEELDKSEKDHLDINFFPKRSHDVNEKSLRSSFSDNLNFDHQINASTPVKYNHYNNTGNSSSIENCFGFDEPEEFEEPLISPIKNSLERITTHSGDTVPTPHRFYQKQDNGEKKEEIPVSQVIKMLKYGTDDDNNSGNKIRSSFGSVSPIFNDPAAENDKENIREDKFEKTVKPVNILLFLLSLIDYLCTLEK